MGSPESENGRENDEGPQREVTVSQPFYMGIHEVTQEQYRAVCGPIGDPSHFKGAKNPAEQLSWRGAETFCIALSHIVGLEFSVRGHGQISYAAWYVRPWREVVMAK